MLQRYKDTIARWLAPDPWAGNAPGNAPSRSPKPNRRSPTARKVSTSVAPAGNGDVSYYDAVGRMSARGSNS